MTREEIHAYLDKFIDEAAISEGAKDMAGERRRVLIASNEDGTPIYKFLRAETTDDMNDKIVKSYVESGRIWEFLKIPGLQAEKPGVKMKKYATEWLQRKRRVKETTMVNYRLYVNSYIIPFLGNKNVNEITVMDIQAMLDKNKKRAKKTLTEIKAVLGQIMRYAISDGLITRNPCESVDLVIPSDRETQRQALALEDYKDIIANLKNLRPEDELFLAIYLYTGMRRGEGLGLRWEDIDFERDEIHVLRNATYAGSNVPSITSPKTKAGTRTIPLDPSLKEILLRNKGTGYVIGGSEPISSTTLKTTTARIERTIDMHGATLHVLRHSFLTYAVGETTDYKTVQGLSGHSDVFTLMNRYAHPQASKVKALSEGLHAIFTENVPKMCHEKSASKP